MASNAAVAALLKPTYQHGRNNFPLDNKQVYSLKAGQITPVKCFHYEPDSFLNIKAHDFTMTFPMQTAPFLRGRKEFSFYSVYYNSIWSLFNQYQGTKNDPKTSAFGKTPTLQEPRMDMYSLFYGVFAQWFMYQVHEHFIPFYVNYQSVVEQMFDAFYVEKYTKEAQSSYLSFGFDQQASWADVYFEINSASLSYHSTYTPTSSLAVRLEYRDLFNEQGNNYDYAHYCQDVVGHFRAYNWMRKLDMLGYGNLYPLFKYYESVFIQLLDTSVTIEYVWNNFCTLCDTIIQQLYDMTHTYDGTIPNQTNVVPLYCNLYPICAYNSVFYHFFRNSFYDLDYDPHNYNLDFVSVDTSHGNYNLLFMSDFTLRFLDIEYHQWKKDTFTGVLPDTQFGAVSSVEIDMSGSISVSGTTNSDQLRWSKGGVTLSSNDTVVTGASGSLYSNSYATGNGLIHDHTFTGTGSINNTSFDVIALKRAEMLQDYRQQLMRAGNRTSDVFKAIYGGAPSSEHEDDVIPRFLETFGEDLFVDPVTATADTGQANNGNLGDIASRGKFRGDSKEIKFNAGFNFGCIICFAYVVPTAEYNSYMFDKHIFELSPELHFIPQFENSGLEEILSDELNMLQDRNNIRVLGYGPRYHHKKSEVDMVHGAFCSVPSNIPTSLTAIPVDWFGDFNNWVSPRTDLQNRNTTSIKDFYINPSVLDNVFVRSAGADQADDQFICNTYFEVNAVKSMSKVGLINFV